MKSVSGFWKECIVSYQKVQDDGLEKKVSEKYVLNALTFGKAEECILKEVSSYVSGEVKVVNINPCVFGEVFFDEENADADRWYKARLAFITIDESTEKQKRSRVYYLVQASSFDGAKKAIDSVMGGTMIDYVIEKVEETKYVDVFKSK